jgi:hypothetical protein
LSALLRPALVLTLIRAAILRLASTFLPTSPPLVRAAPHRSGGALFSEAP